MPKRSATMCRCGRLTARGLCDVCRKSEVREAREHDQRRGSSAARGYGYRWQQYVRHYKQEHPLCRRCEEKGKVSTTQCVDHVQPVTGPDDPRFWDPTNHQPLCDPCHGEKTVLEDGGFGNAKRRYEPGPVAPAVDDPVMA